MRGRGAQVKRANGMSASSAKLTLAAQRFARRMREKPARAEADAPSPRAAIRDAAAARGAHFVRIVSSQVHVPTYSFGISPLRRTALANTFPARREIYRKFSYL